MDDPVRIVMVGKTGAGKSSTGNTILGCRRFHAQASGTSVTKECTMMTSRVCGRKVTLVDTPGLFDTSISNQTIEAEIGKCVEMVTPGPHVFLIVVAVGRFTKEEQEAVHIIKQIFGADISTFAIVLLTRKDDLDADGQTVEDYYKRAGPELKALIAHCGGRYHAFNNRDNTSRHKQVNTLMEKVQALMNENGKCYTSQLFQMASTICTLRKQIEQEKQNKKGVEAVMVTTIKIQKQMLDLQNELIQSRERVRELEESSSCTIL